MSGTTWIIGLVAAAFLLVVILVAIVQGRRRRQLRELFGPDYHRALSTDGGPGSDDDAAVAHPQREPLPLRPLGPAESHSFRMDWQRVQNSFVDRPALAVHEADALLMAVFRARGLPPETFEQPASSVPPELASTVERYLTAQVVHLRADSSETTTDELRAAFVQYRELFDELTSEGGALRADQGQRVRP